jgi:hypothetical protein
MLEDQVYCGIDHGLVGNRSAFGLRQRLAILRGRLGISGQCENFRLPKRSEKSIRYSKKLINLLSTSK